MSLQEAASSGSFSPHVAQPSDPQRSDAAFNPPTVDGDVGPTSIEATSPFGGDYAYTASADELMSDAAEPDLRASRRRAWTVVGLAIVIPAAVAGLIAWQLFGVDEAPAPIVTRVTTTPAEPVAQEVDVATAAPTTSSVAASPEPTASPTATTNATAAVSTASAAAATDAGAPEAAAASTAAVEVDLVLLTPAARLAAWFEIETIQVLPGETLWLIAQNYGTTISAIATLNGIANPEMLSVGQELKIPVGFAEEVAAAPVAASDAVATATEDAGSTAPAVASTSSPPLSDDLYNWHTIAPVSIDAGDSLAAIAQANTTTVEAIMALNGISDPNLIFVGDTLLIPVGYQGDAGVTIESTQLTSLETGQTEAASGAASDDLMEEEGVGAGVEDDMMEE